MGDQTPPPAGDQRSLLRGNARVWLATLSTVVGVATGMFTLRDQVFPGEGGSARAVSVPAYQQEVGRICDQVNANDRSRAHEDTTLRVRLHRAGTTVAQRNALLDPVRRTIARSGHTLASFAALETPTALAASSRSTKAAWDRNLMRLRDYALRLDRVSTRAQLFAALDHLSRLRPLLASDGVQLASGLDRLGGPNCDLQPPRVTTAITLPALRTRTPATRSRLVSKSRPGAGRTRELGARENSVGATVSGVGSSGGGAGGSTSTANTPAAASRGGGAGTKSAAMKRMKSLWRHGTPKFRTNTPGAEATARG